MMKASAKRRRSKAQILEDKEAALKKDTEIKQKLAAWEQMERDNAEMRESLEKAQVLHNQVQGMFDEGLLA